MRTSISDTTKDKVFSFQISSHEFLRGAGAFKVTACFLLVRLLTTLLLALLQMPAAEGR